MQVFTQQGGMIFLRKLGTFANIRTRAVDLITEQSLGVYTPYSTILRSLKFSGVREHSVESALRGILSLPGVWCREYIYTLLFLSGALVSAVSHPTAPVLPLQRP